MLGAVIYCLEQLTISVWLPEGDWRRWISFDHPTLSQVLLVFGVAFLFSIAYGLTIALKRIPTRAESRSPLRRISIAWLITVVSLVVGSNSGVLVTWTARHQIREIIYEMAKLPATNFGPRNDPRLPPTDWIRNTSDKDSIVAHSAMCPYLPEVGVSPPIEISPECAQRSTSSWVAALTHRRAYLDRPLNALAKEFDLPEANFRYRNSVLFATEALPSAMDDFERVGVDYFVVDLSQTELRSWEPYGTIVYRDENYLVLKLNY
jgi:hypothetical protein